MIDFLLSAFSLLRFLFFHTPVGFRISTPEPIDLPNRVVGDLLGLQMILPNPWLVSAEHAIPDIQRIPKLWCHWLCA